MTSDHPEGAAPYRPYESDDDLYVYNSDSAIFNASTESLPDDCEVPASWTRAMIPDQPQVHYYTARPNGSDSAHRRDLMHKIKGLYRLLDIYSEEGSGGLGTILPREMP